LFFAINEIKLYNRLYMHLSLSEIFQTIIEYRYLFLFPAAMIEGPIITVIAGFFASQGIMNVYIVYFVVVAGDITEDFLYFAFGRWGLNGIIGRWGKYIGITKEKIRKLEKHFDHHGAKTIFLGKLAHGVGTAVLVSAGASKISASKFFWYNLAATIPKSLILLLIGFYFGSAYAKIGKYFDYLAILGLVLAAVLILAYSAIVKYSKKLEKEL
jgi:membrane protein DedA with SNARE-associated domain